MWEHCYTGLNSGVYPIYAKNTQILVEMSNNEEKSGLLNKLKKPFKSHSRSSSTTSSAPSSPSSNKNERKHDHHGDSESSNVINQAYLEGRKKADGHRSSGSTGADAGVHKRSGSSEPGVITTTSVGKLKGAGSKPSPLSDLQPKAEERVPIAASDTRKHPNDNPEYRNDGSPHGKGVFYEHNPELTTAGSSSKEIVQLAYEEGQRAARRDYDDANKRSDNAQLAAESAAAKKSSRPNNGDSKTLDPALERSQNKSLYNPSGVSLAALDHTDTNPRYAGGREELERVQAKGAEPTSSDPKSSQSKSSQSKSADSRTGTGSRSGQSASQDPNDPSYLNESVPPSSDNFDYKTELSRLDNQIEQTQREIDNLSSLKSGNNGNNGNNSYAGGIAAGATGALAAAAGYIGLTSGSEKSTHPVVKEAYDAGYAKGKSGATNAGVSSGTGSHKDVGPHKDIIAEAYAAGANKASEDAAKGSKSGNSKSVGATGPQYAGAAGSQPVGATNSKSVGATDSQTAGAGSSRSGGSADSTDAYKSAAYTEGVKAGAYDSGSAAAAYKHGTATGAYESGQVAGAKDASTKGVSGASTTDASNASRSSPNKSATPGSAQSTIQSAAGGLAAGAAAAATAAAGYLGYSTSNKDHPVVREAYQAGVNKAAYEAGHQHHAKEVSGSSSLDPSSNKSVDPAINKNVDPANKSGAAGAPSGVASTGILAGVASTLGFGSDTSRSHQDDLKQGQDAKQRGILNDIKQPVLQDVDSDSDEDYEIVPHPNESKEPEKVADSRHEGQPRSVTADPANKSRDLEEKPADSNSSSVYGAIGAGGITGAIASAIPFYNSNSNKNDKEVKDSESVDSFKDAEGAGDADGAGDVTGNPGSLIRTAEENYDDVRQAPTHKGTGKATEGSEGRGESGDGVQDVPGLVPATEDSDKSVKQDDSGSKITEDDVAQYNKKHGFDKKAQGSMIDAVEDEDVKKEPAHKTEKAETEAAASSDGNSDGVQDIPGIAPVPQADREVEKKKDTKKAPPSTGKITEDDVARYNKEHGHKQILGSLVDAALKYDDVKNASKHKSGKSPTDDAPEQKSGGGNNVQEIPGLAKSSDDSGSKSSSKDSSKDSTKDSNASSKSSTKHTEDEVAAYNKKHGNSGKGSLVDAAADSREVKEAPAHKKGTNNVEQDDNQGGDNVQAIPGLNSTNSKGKSDRGVDSQDKSLKDGESNYADSEYSNASLYSHPEHTNVHEAAGLGGNGLPSSTVTPNRGALSARDTYGNQEKSASKPDGQRLDHSSVPPQADSAETGPELAGASGTPSGQFSRDGKPVDGDAGTSHAGPTDQSSTTSPSRGLSSIGSAVAGISAATGAVLGTGYAYLTGNRSGGDNLNTKEATQSLTVSGTNEYYNAGIEKAAYEAGIQKAAYEAGQNFHKNGSGSKSAGTTAGSAGSTASSGAAGAAGAAGVAGAAGAGAASRSVGSTSGGSGAAGSSSSKKPTSELKVEVIGVENRADATVLAQKVSKDLISKGFDLSSGDLVVDTRAGVITLNGKQVGSAHPKSDATSSGAHSSQGAHQSQGAYPSGQSSSRQQPSASSPIASGNSKSIDTSSGSRGAPSSSGTGEIDKSAFYDKSSAPVMPGTFPA